MSLYLCKQGISLPSQSVRCKLPLCQLLSYQIHYRQYTQPCILEYPASGWESCLIGTSSSSWASHGCMLSWSTWNDLLVGPSSRLLKTQYQGICLKSPKSTLYIHTWFWKKSKNPPWWNSRLIYLETRWYAQKCLSYNTINKNLQGWISALLSYIQLLFR